MAGLAQGSTTNQDQAAKLDEDWTVLGKTFDVYYDVLPKKVQDTIRAALASWQNFYYGSDTWPAAELSRWQTIFTAAAQTLKAAVPVGAKPSEPVTSEANRKVSTSEIFTVTGKGDLSSLNFGMPPWWAWALGALPALAILYLTRKTGL